MSRVDCHLDEFCLNFALVNSHLVCRNFVIMYTTRWLNMGCFHSRLECCTICPMY